MQVILRENVENLGRIGDIVKVTDGYARNYLIPRGLVTIADEKNKATIEHHKRGLERKRLAQRAGSEDLAKKLGDFSVNISRKVGEHDKLFGSVSTNDIAEALKAGGFTFGCSPCAREARHRRDRDREGLGRQRRELSSRVSDLSRMGSVQGCADPTGVFAVGGSKWQIMDFMVRPIFLEAVFHRTISKQNVPS
jgi:large subunit ribosomal protein L9